MPNLTDDEWAALFNALMCEAEVDWQAYDSAIAKIRAHRKEKAA